jgi:hypothetical protein
VVVVLSIARSAPEGAVQYSWKMPVALDYIKLVFDSFSGSRAGFLATMRKLFGRDTACKKKIARK